MPDQRAHAAIGDDAAPDVERTGELRRVGAQAKCVSRATMGASMMTMAANEPSRSAASRERPNEIAKVAAPARRAGATFEAPDKRQAAIETSVSAPAKYICRAAPARPPPAT